MTTVQIRRTALPSIPQFFEDYMTFIALGALDLRENILIPFEGFPIWKEYGNLTEIREHFEYYTEKFGDSDRLSPSVYISVLDNYCNLLYNMYEIMPPEKKLPSCVRLKFEFVTTPIYYNVDIASLNVDPFQGDLFAPEQAKDNLSFWRLYTGSYINVQYSYSGG